MTIKETEPYFNSDMVVSAKSAETSSTNKGATRKCIFYLNRREVDLEKTAVAVAASFQKVQSFWSVSLSYLRTLKDVLWNERTILFIVIYGFSFGIKFKEMFRALFTRYSTEYSGPATCSSFVSFFPPMKTPWRLVKTINWEVLYLPSHREIEYNEEIQRAAETWVCHAFEFGFLNPSGVRS